MQQDAALHHQYCAGCDRGLLEVRARSTDILLPYQTWQESIANGIQLHFCFAADRKPDSHLRNPAQCDRHFPNGGWRLRPVSSYSLHCFIWPASRPNPLVSSRGSQARSKVFFSIALLHYISFQNLNFAREQHGRPIFKALSRRETVFFRNSVTGRVQGRQKCLSSMYKIRIIQQMRWTPF